MEEEPQRPEDGKQPEPSDEERLAAELLARINAAGIRTLGEIATVHGGEDDERDAGTNDAEKHQPTPPGDTAGGTPASPDTPDDRPERDDEPHPRIYVVSLGDLLVGNAHGVWIDADQDPDALEDCIFDMLASSQWATDQWAIHDVEGFFSLPLSGFEDIGRVSRLARGLQAHGEALARWVGYLGTAHLDEALATFATAYRGHFESVMGYVRHLAETDQFPRYLSAIPQHLLAAHLKGVAASLPESTAELYIVESRDGGIHVFDASEDA
jgi:antirestriction protein